jgi:hypothetical protein
MKESADKPERQKDLSFLEFSKINEDENDSEISIFDSFYKSNLSIKSEKNSNELFFLGNKSYNRMGTVKDEKQNNRNEVIKELDENNNKINEVCVETEKEEDFKNNIHLIIARLIKHFMQKIEEGEKLDGLNLFNIIDFLKNSIGNIMNMIMSKGDNIFEKDPNILMTFLQKSELLDDIQNFKTQEKDEDKMSTNRIFYLKEKIILFEEEVGRKKEIRKEIKTKLGNKSQPIELLNLAIKIFIMDLLEEQIQYKYTMAFHENKIKENQPEIKEIKNIGKKRDYFENIDENSLNVSKVGNNIERISYRADNISMKFKRNLIQKIFLDWINYGESDKKKRLKKLDPAIFKSSYDFKGKTLKEIYSQNISLKGKNLDKNFNINIIEKAKGIKNIKLNFSFKQALKLFYYKKIDDLEIFNIIKNLNETENVNDLKNKIIEGLKSKEKYLAQKGKEEDLFFKKKLEKVLVDFERKYLIH